MKQLIVSWRPMESSPPQYALVEICCYIAKRAALYHTCAQLKSPRGLLVLSIGICFWWAIATTASHALEGTEVVAFQSIPFTYAPSSFALKRAKKLGKQIEPKIEPIVRLTGYLKRPTGDGPRPAVVLLHTCAGISEHERYWIEVLVSWGYVVLSVDSLTPRGLEYICDGRSGSIAPWNRALDAYGGKEFLSSLPYVDPDRIAVMGMSHGGMAVLDIVKSATSNGINMRPFRAAVAFYPLCGESTEVDMPALILVGGEDSWTPAELCQRYVEGLGDSSNMTLKVFEDAHHLFDHPGIDIVELGYVLRSNPEARDKTKLIVQEFLELNVN